MSNGMFQGIVKKLVQGNSRRIIQDPSKKRPAVELLPWSLYHRQGVAAAGSQTLTFFRNIGGGATLLDTNLTTAGLLPYPQSFDIFGIAIVPAFGVSDADMTNFYNNSVVTFALSNKPYLQIPIMRIPAACGFHGVATTNNVFQVQNGLPSPQNTWSMAISGMSLYVPHQQDFAMEIRTFNQVAFTAAFNVTVYMDGVLARPVL